MVVELEDKANGNPDVILPLPFQCEWLNRPCLAQNIDGTVSQKDGNVIYLEGANAKAVTQTNVQSAANRHREIRLAGIEGIGDRPI